METKLSNESRSEFFCLPLVDFSIKYPTKQTARVKQKTPPHLLRFINLPIIFGSSLFSVGKRKLRKIGPRGNTGGDVRTIAGPWEGRRGLEERLAAKSPTLELKVVGTSEP